MKTQTISALVRALWIGAAALALALLALWIVWPAVADADGPSGSFNAAGNCRPGRACKAKSFSATAAAGAPSIVSTLGSYWYPAGAANPVRRVYASATNELFVENMSVRTGNSFIANTPSGSSALSLTVNGARVDVGAGTNDYVYSDGTNILTPAKLCDDSGSNCATFTPRTTFAGYAAVNTEALVFVQTRTTWAGTAQSLEFTTTVAGVGAGNAVLKLANTSKGTSCTVTFACTTAAGTLSSASPSCGLTVNTGDILAVSWDASSACTTLPTGNVVVTSERT